MPAYLLHECRGILQVLPGESDVQCGGEEAGGVPAAGEQGAASSRPAVSTINGMAP
jgi:hypothetical protein